MGLAWQQLGWLIHEFAHNQLFKDHWHNDLASYVVGNLLQGFSSGGWKEQHNIHHAATNVVGRDGDLDLMPLWATVVQDLKMADNWWLTILPYPAHLLVCDVATASNKLASTVDCICQRDAAALLQVLSGQSYYRYLLTIHWILVLIQLYLLPSMQIRLLFFAVSQLTGGFLLAHVVTYNHYSVDKFPYTSKIMSNYACLQVNTTRNMRPGIFIDWLWGGLNYQIEHHLFPTMPRHNLSKVMPLVKQFCAENDLPYMVDDYFTGWKLEIQQFANVARIASKMKSKIL
ncbi:stearoyl-CoA 9-desaturase [Ostertagia ostertagi]